MKYKTFGYRKSETPMGMTRVKRRTANRNSSEKRKTIRRSTVRRIDGSVDDRLVGLSVRGIHRLPIGRTSISTSVRVQYSSGTVVQIARQPSECSRTSLRGSTHTRSKVYSLNREYRTAIVPDVRT